MHSIAPLFVRVLKYDPAQARGPKGSPEGGRWIKGSAGKEYWSGEGTPTEPVVGRKFTSDEGYQWHEKGPVAEWAKALPYADVRVINDYAGFGYHDVNDLRRGTYKTPIVSHFVRAATPEEMKRVGWDTEKNDWVPSVEVKDGYKPGYEVDPRDASTPESLARFGYHMGQRDATGFDPEDPYHQVADGRIVVNQFYRPDPDGTPMMFSIQRAGPDLERLHEVQQSADALDDLVRHRGYELPEAITVERGAYLPGVSFKDLQDMQYEGPNGEPPAVWEEKGFTSTMVGEAGRRAISYPALGKWESISHRFGSGSGVLVQHQDEVGSAVRFHITLPTGTKVAGVEGVRRLTHEFPRIQDPSVFEHPEWLADGKLKAEDFTKADMTQTPKVKATDLEAGKDGRRIESELLLGSGARFKITKVQHGETYQTGDPTLKPVPIVEVSMEYIGGGSSEGVKH